MTNKPKMWRKTPKVSANGEKKLHREGSGVQWSAKGCVTNNPLLVALLTRAGVVFPKVPVIA